MTVPDPDPRAVSAALEDLVAECLDRLEGEGPAALEELCRRHPRHARDLRAQVSALGRLGMLDLPDVGAESFPDRLGDFRLEERLGGGGMGVVYRAHQESLDRAVALKVVRPEHLFFPGARERFRREVETVARLGHPGIVPIHTVGEEAGVPYFVMELVRGITLADAIDELSGRAPGELAGTDLARAIARRTGDEDGAEAALFRGSWAETAMRVAHAVAEALAHAHRRGVLHRDVKPSNVMVTRSGRVLLLDFGLASSSGAERLTRSGSPIGSLAYMPPEQLSGAGAVDERGDVYSLGVTLFELLALRLPYRGQSATAVMREILDARPADLSALHPGLPRDVDTVCRTAMAARPERRYASVTAFARDLDNLLAHRPIEARRATALERAELWTRRHPARAVAAGLALLLLLGGPSLWAWKERRTGRELAALNVELEAARTRAEENFQRAFEAVRSVLRTMADEDLVHVPRMQRARVDVIDRALAVVEGLSESAPQDRALARERGRLLQARGDALTNLGRQAEALADYAEHQAVLRARLAAGTASREERRDLAVGLRSSGKALAELGRASEAADDFRACAELYAELADEDPGARLALVTALVVHAETLRQLGRFDEAEAGLFRALELGEALRDERPEAAEVHFRLAQVLSNLTELASTRGERAAALDWGRRALAAAESAAARAPEDRFVRYQLAECLFSLAGAESWAGDQPAAEASVRAALPIRAELVAEFPAVVLYEERQADTLGLLGTILSRQLRGHEAVEIARDVATRRTRLSQRSPKNAELLDAEAVARLNLAATLIFNSGDRESAVAEAERAIALTDRCLELHPGVAKYRRTAGRARYNRALALCLLDAAAAAREAIEEYEPFVDDDPELLRFAADLWNEWILARRRAEPDPERLRADESLARERIYGWLAQAVERGYLDLAELESTPALDSFRGEPELERLIDEVRAAREQAASQ